jgi:hypothetical protein
MQYTIDEPPLPGGQGIENLPPPSRSGIQNLAPSLAVGALIMPIPMAYLITFTCCGTRLHGDETGSVDEDHDQFGTPLVPANPRRVSAQQKQMKQPPYRLDHSRRATVLGSLRQH